MTTINPNEVRTAWLLYVSALARATKKVCDQCAAKSPLTRYKREGNYSLDLCASCTKGIR